MNKVIRQIGRILPELGDHLRYQDALEADAKRYRFLRKTQLELSLPHKTIGMLLADQAELDATIAQVEGGAA